MDVFVSLGRGARAVNGDGFGRPPPGARDSRRSRRPDATAFFGATFLTGFFGTTFLTGFLTTFLTGFLTTFLTGRLATFFGAARAIIDEIERDLPAGASLAVWDDQSKRYEDRLDLLARNAVIGLGLVLLLLGLFLEPRVAFWVTMGIVISVVGSFIVFPATGATINMVSLFAFIVTLGIIVDDAIIVGENIFELREKGMDPLDAAIEGARQIAMPVVFAVLTNVIAFMPLFLLGKPLFKLLNQFFQIIKALQLV